MIRSVLFLLAGMAIGVLLVPWLTNSDSSETLPERFASLPDIRESGAGRKLSIEETTVLREDAYASIRTVRDTLALPTEFDQIAALYALAGRSDAAELQGLIYEANGIAEPAQRGMSIGILFRRLTNLDPRSALAIARSPALKGIRAFEYEVWEYWAQNDLEAALGEAMSLPDSHRSRAAQGIFRSFDLPEGNTVFDIQMLLGSEPDNTTLSVWMASLYDYSPGAAVDFVESLPPGMLQNNAVWVLAYRIAQSGQFSAPVRFATRELQELFDYRFTEQIAQTDPEQAIDLYLSSERNSRYSSPIPTAMRKLASSDPDRAMALLDRLEGSDRQSAIRAIGEGLVTSDPERALAWIREHFTNPGDGMIGELMSQIARRNPELAIQQAELIEGVYDRNEALLRIAATLAANDAVTALGVVDRISDPGYRQSALSTIVQRIAIQNPDKAIEIYDTLPVNDRRGVLESTVHMIARSDPDKALSLIARVAPGEAHGLRESVIYAVSDSSSFDTTMAFLERFRDEPDFERIQSRVARSLSMREPEDALEYANEHLSGQHYERVVASAAPLIAGKDPRRALDMATRMSDPELRTEATQGVVSNWMARDPAATANWLSSQPASREKDRLLESAMSSSASDPEMAIRLLDQVSDRVFRYGMAKNYASIIYWNYPAAVEPFLDAAGFNEAAKRDFEQEMQRQTRYR